MISQWNCRVSSSRLEGNHGFHGWERIKNGGRAFLSPATPDTSGHGPDTFLNCRSGFTPRSHQTTSPQSGDKPPPTVYPAFSPPFLIPHSRHHRRLSPSELSEFFVVNPFSPSAFLACFARVNIYVFYSCITEITVNQSVDIFHYFLK